MAQDGIFYLDPWPQQGPRKIAPLTLTYGQQPPRKAALAVSALLCIQAWNPPDPQPTQKRVQIAPLTLTYGQQPPPQTTGRLLASIRQQWETTWDAQKAPPNAAWNFSPVVVTFVPYTPAWLQAVRLSWQGDQQPVQRSAVIASLTLVYGDQPPLVRQSPPPATLLPAATWDTQSAPKSAAWNIAVQAFVPFNRQWQSIVLSTWDNAPGLPVRTRNVVQVTVTPTTIYGFFPFF